jgi:hypothetical protein
MAESSSSAAMAESSSAAAQLAVVAAAMQGWGSSSSSCSSHVKGLLIHVARQASGSLEQSSSRSNTNAAIQARLVARHGTVHTSCWQLTQCTTVPFETAMLLYSLAVVSLILCCREGTPCSATCLVRGATWAAMDVAWGQAAWSQVWGFATAAAAVVTRPAHLKVSECECKHTAW